MLSCSFGGTKSQQLVEGFVTCFWPRYLLEQSCLVPCCHCFLGRLGASKFRVAEVHLLGHCVAGDEHRSAELLMMEKSIFSVGLQNLSCTKAGSCRDTPFLCPLLTQNPKARDSVIYGLGEQKSLEQLPPTTELKQQAWSQAHQRDVLIASHCPLFTGVFSWECQTQWRNGTIASMIR